MAMVQRQSETLQQTIVINHNCLLLFADDGDDGDNGDDGDDGDSGHQPPELQNVNFDIQSESFKRDDLNRSVTAVRG